MMCIPTARRWASRTAFSARAIENQVYIAGVNRIGTDGKGHAYEKSSVIVDANGENLGPIASAGPELDTFDVSSTALAAFRSEVQNRFGPLFATRAGMQSPEAAKAFMLHAVAKQPADLEIRRRLAEPDVMARSA